MMASVAVFVVEAPVRVIELVLSRPLAVIFVRRS